MVLFLKFFLKGCQNYQIQSFIFLSKVISLIFQPLIALISLKRKIHTLPYVKAHISGFEAFLVMMGLASDFIYIASRSGPKAEALAKCRSFFSSASASKAEAFWPKVW